MKSSRPGVLAVRAVNQYRHRDILTYLGLRYYLENSAAHTDLWAEQVAIDLVLNRSTPIYMPVNHFKETNDSGQVTTREMFLPGANEALAEAALLAECAKHPEVFGSPDSVYSYRLSQGDDRSGVYQPYSYGLLERHNAIACACDAHPGGIVRYTDIKKFYPSIKPELAIKTWFLYSDRAGLASCFRDLGVKLLGDHEQTGKENSHGILTGPMFSHLIANLVLRQLDDELARTLPVKYFRYVDDITLVGARVDVYKSVQELRHRLEDLEFEMHDDDSPKSIEVLSLEWQTARHDYQESKSAISWKTLIADLKRFLILNPEGKGNLQEAFRGEGFRIPVRDYSSAVYEGTYLERIWYLAQRRWFRRKSQAVTISGLVAQAKWLRERYQREFLELHDEARTTQSFQLKRRIPKLRYRAGRLVYLAPDDVLTELSLGAEELPELHFHAQVMKAVGSGDLSGILPFGTNAAQAAAQPLKAADKPGHMHREINTTTEEQALAVFLLNGVKVDSPKNEALVHSELMQVAVHGSDMTLMKDGIPFISELACLHGIASGPRHSQMLESVFDKDEGLAMDAIDQLQQSAST